MRSAVAAVAIVALLGAQIPPTPSFAQSAESVRLQQPTSANPAVAGAFAAFPKGGDLLSKRIADLVVRNPQVAMDVLNYVRATPGLSHAQKLAAERGLAMALDRLGIKAADMPVKAPPPPPVVVEYDYSWLALLAAAAIAVAVCVTELCRENRKVVQISPN
jgi:hypothetical protein